MTRPHDNTLSTSLLPATAPSHGGRAWLALILCLGLAACAGGKGVKTDAAEPMAALEQRAVERWNLLIEGKTEQAYDYLTPGYRASRTLAEYLSKPRNPMLAWKKITWHGGDCQSPESCQVRLLLDYVTTVAGAGEIPGIQEVTERWLLVEGTWFHLPND